MFINLVIIFVLILVMIFVTIFVIIFSFGIGLQILYHNQTAASAVIGHHLVHETAVGRDFYHRKLARPRSMRGRRRLGLLSPLSAAIAGAVRPFFAT